LQYIHQQYPKVATSFLAEKDGDKLDQQLATLGFSPHTYSPQYRFVSKALVAACHAKGIKILPWTVNTKEAMQKLIADGVDGIISDYPDLFAQLPQNK
jgi:glycerophosphoryl diester phosphodiesterase